MRIDLLEKELGFRFGLVAADFNGPFAPNVPDICPGWVFDGLAGNSFPKDETVDFAGNWIGTFLKYGIDTSDEKILAEISRRRFEHDKPLLVMFDWVPWIIVQSVKSRKLAIVTDTSLEMVEYVLPEYVRKDISSIVTCDRLRKLGMKLKPAPDGLLLACEETGVEPGRTLYIGDKEKDRLAAEAAGMKCLLAPEGKHHVFFSIG